MPDLQDITELLPSLIAPIPILAAFALVYWLLAKSIRKMTERIATKDESHRAELEEWARELVTFLRRGFQIVPGLIVVYVVLRGLGIAGLPKFSWEELAGWASGPGMRIVVVAGAAFLVIRILNMLISRLPGILLIRARIESPLKYREQSQRLDTVTRLMQSLATAIVVGLAVLIMLREVGLDITPILAGLGIGGLALGFGAQNLVRDVISGFFIILENQIAVGDVARINGKGGVVEAIRLRTIVLRDLDGTVHVIPAGSINELSNMTKDFSYYVMDLGVAYKENTDHVVAVVKEVAAGLRRDPAYAHRILEDLEVLGVDQFADSAVVIKARIKTMPIQQWTVGRELRRRIKFAFDEKGIEIPFPHLSIDVGEASKPFAVQLKEREMPANGDEQSEAARIVAPGAPDAASPKSQAVSRKE